MVSIFESFVRLQKEVDAAQEPNTKKNDMEPSTMKTYMSLKKMKLNLDSRLN
jgi:hypothetical protein